jgi:hypothetical protein
VVTPRSPSRHGLTRHIAARQYGQGGSSTTHWTPLPRKLRRRAKNGRKAGRLPVRLKGEQQETAPLAEEHRDEMNLELVKDAGSERELRGSGAVDQHVLVARSLLGLGHRGPDVGHVGNQRPLPRPP